MFPCGYSSSHPKSSLWNVRFSLTLLCKFHDFPYFTVIFMIWTVSTESLYFLSNFKRFSLFSTPLRGDLDEMYFTISISSTLFSCDLLMYFCLLLYFKRHFHSRISLSFMIL